MGGEDDSIERQMDVVEERPTANFFGRIKRRVGEAYTAHQERKSQRMDIEITKLDKQLELEKRRAGIEAQRSAIAKQRQLQRSYRDSRQSSSGGGFSFGRLNAPALGIGGSMWGGSTFGQPQVPKQTMPKKIRRPKRKSHKGKRRVVTWV